MIEPVLSAADGSCTTAETSGFVLPPNWLVNLNKDETAAFAADHSGQY